MPKSRTFSECIRAFLIGGGICIIGQGISNFGKHVLMLGIKDNSSFTAIVMVFLGAFFTGLGLYDVLGKFAGAGSIVPITGFANSIVSPAMEFRRDESSIIRPSQKTAWYSG
ncbi:MAG: SpoVA/SpoVAEb family sporulation membrane protein [Christensenellaceae bacterium]|nr:SpoVA/SpoVAEb family sporulation membrane protein [Christensenellaceae bacterium]